MGKWPKLEGECGSSSHQQPVLGALRLAGEGAGAGAGEEAGEEAGAGAGSRLFLCIEHLCELKDKGKAGGTRPAPAG